MIFFYQSWVIFECTFVKKVKIGNNARTLEDFTELLAENLILNKLARYFQILSKRQRKMERE